MSPAPPAQMDPKPDHGEESYRGSGKLEGKAAVITGGDSGIGRAVAIAFAREGADVLISYLNEHERRPGDRAAGSRRPAARRVLVAGDLADPAHCRDVVDRAVEEFGRVDVLVNNAAFQMTRESLEEISDEEWDRTFAHQPQRDVPPGQGGAAAHAGGRLDHRHAPRSTPTRPSPTLLPYAATKAAIANFTAGLAQTAGGEGHPGQQRRARARSGRR